MTEQKTRRETETVSLWVKVQTGLMAAILILLVVAILLLAGSVKRLDHSLELVQADPAVQFAVAFAQFYQSELRRGSTGPPSL